MKVKELIRFEGYTQQQVADHLGLSLRGLTYKLKGNAIFSHEERKKLSRLLHTPLKDIENMIREETYK